MKIRVTTAFNDRQNGYVTRPVNEVLNVPSREQRNSLTVVLQKRSSLTLPKSREPKQLKQKNRKSGLSTLRICKVLFYCPKTLNYGRHRAKLKQRDTL